MYKVFVNDHPVFIRNLKDPVPFKGDGLQLIQPSNDELVLCIKGLLNDPASDYALHLFYQDPQEVWNNLPKVFIHLEAAGGYVLNQEGQALFIFRLGKWDLPKGKIEEGESIEEAAKREVEEECGIGDLKIISSLPATYHIYQLKEDLYFKTTHWFQMLSNDRFELVPQTEENIEAVVWADAIKQQELLKNTYPNIIELLRSLTI